jgi:hypothetical protein
MFGLKYLPQPRLEAGIQLLKYGTAVPNHRMHLRLQHLGVDVRGAGNKESRHG